MGAPTLDRLIDAEALRAVLESAAALAPDLVISVVGSGGGPIAGEPVDLEAAAVVRPIALDGAVIGQVLVGGGSPMASAVAELVGRAIDLAAGEGLGRRRVTAAAIDDLRELALL